LLVLYHAFAIFSGAWPPINGYPSIESYWWLDKIAYSFMLESFVFVSGYLYGFKVRTCGFSNLSFKSSVVKKIKRLLIPCFIYSIIYVAIFRDYNGSVSNSIYSILVGAGHLWFLPMLFWCFICMLIIERIHVNLKYVFLFAIICAIFGGLPLPFRLGNTMQYFIFFLIGYTIQQKNSNIKNFISFKCVFSLIIIYILSFVSSMIISKNGGLMDGHAIIVKFMRLAFNNSMRLIYSSTGLFAMYLLINRYIQIRKYNPSNTTIKVSGYCFGVYIYQQFILHILYDFTSLPKVCNPYVLPWAGFLITVLLSLALTHLTLKMKIGKSLIG
jgi:fucose 4-O-acetylase-like acetyltransferase